MKCMIALLLFFELLSIKPYYSTKGFQWEIEFTNSLGKKQIIRESKVKFIIEDISFAEEKYDADTKTVHLATSRILW